MVGGRGIRVGEVMGIFALKSKEFYLDFKLQAGKP